MESLNCLSNRVLNFLFGTSKKSIEFKLLGFHLMKFSFLPEI